MTDRRPGFPGDEGGAPRRRSMRDRMAQASSCAPEVDLAAGPGDPSDLTSTSLGALPSLEDFSTAFVVGEEGVTRTDALAPISATLSTSGPAGVIGLSDARSHHLLLLADEVDPSEIEALALSIWDVAAWEGAGLLRLADGARLEGPWAIDLEARKALGTPAGLPNAWILRCPMSRRSPVPKGLAEIDEWTRVFSEGTPTGLEYRILAALKRMARRLGGAIRVADSGGLVAPDPDSAVSLSVYTPRWLDPSDLIGLLRAEFPGIVDSREVVPAAPVSAQRASAAARVVEEGLGTVRTDIATKIRCAREASERAERASMREVVSGYALLAPVGNRSDLMIEVRPVPTPPQVLRWESWTTGVIIEYALRWLPGGAMAVPSGVSRAARLERMRSARGIERAAALVAASVAGSIVDEDGFLVALDDTAIE